MLQGDSGLQGDTVSVAEAQALRGQVAALTAIVKALFDCLPEPERARKMVHAQLEEDFTKALIWDQWSLIAYKNISSTADVVLNPHSQL